MLWGISSSHQIGFILVGINKRIRRETGEKYELGGMWEEYPCKRTSQKAHPRFTPLFVIELVTLMSWKGAAQSHC